MNEDLYRLVYCSRNRVQGTPHEVGASIREMVEQSSKNNQRHGITGALVFNAGIYAQVLEGRLLDVETIFNKIKQDARHGEVLLLNVGAVRQRQFGGWSMAFADTGLDDRAPEITQILEQAFAHPSEAVRPVTDLLRRLAV